MKYDLLTQRDGSRAAAGDSVISVVPGVPKSAQGIVTRETRIEGLSIGAVGVDEGGSW